MDLIRSSFILFIYLNMICTSQEKITDKAMPLQLPFIADPNATMHDAFQCLKCTLCSAVIDDLKCFLNNTQQVEQTVTKIGDAYCDIFCWWCTNEIGIIICAPESQCDTLCPPYYGAATKMLLTNLFNALATVLNQNDTCENLGACTSPDSKPAYTEQDLGRCIQDMCVAISHHFNNTNLYYFCALIPHNQLNTQLL